MIKTRKQKLDKKNSKREAPGHKVWMQLEAMKNETRKEKKQRKKNIQ